MDWRDVIVSRLQELTLFEILIFKQSNRQLDDYFEDDKILSYLSGRIGKKVESYDDFYNEVSHITR